MAAPSPCSVHIALRKCQAPFELGLDGIAEDLLVELHHPAGVLNHLHGFDTRKFVEKPAAAGIHQHGVALHFKQLPGAHLLVSVEARNEMFFVEALACSPGGGSSRTRIYPSRAAHGSLKQRAPSRLEARSDPVAQPVERLPQRLPPLLVPSGAARNCSRNCCASAPRHGRSSRSCFHRSVLRSGRHKLKKLAVIGDSARAFASGCSRARRPAPFRRTVMMAVGLAVGRDMHQLRTRPFVGKPAHQAVREFFAVVEQFLERTACETGPS